MTPAEVDVRITAALHAMADAVAVLDEQPIRPAAVVHELMPPRTPQPHRVRREVAAVLLAVACAVALLVTSLLVFAGGSRAPVAPAGGSGSSSSKTCSEQVNFAKFARHCSASATASTSDSNSSPGSSVPSNSFSPSGGSLSSGGGSSSP